MGVARQTRLSVELAAWSNLGRIAIHNPDICIHEYVITLYLVLYLSIQILSFFCSGLVRLVGFILDTLKFILCYRK